MHSVEMLLLSASSSISTLTLCIPIVLKPDRTITSIIVYAVRVTLWSIPLLSIDT